MNRRSQIARLLTGGLIGASTTPLPGDEHWDDVTLLLDGSDPTGNLKSGAATVTNPNSDVTTTTTDPGSHPYATDFLAFNSDAAQKLVITNDANVAFGTDDWTFEAWIYQDNSATNETLFDMRATGTSVGGGVFFKNASNQLQFSYKVSTESSSKIIGSGTLTANTWHHVAMTVESNIVTLWLDGVSQGTWDSTTNSFTPLANPGIGYESYTSSGNVEFDGYMADIRITKGVARYISNFTPPTQKFLPFAARPYSGTFGLGDEHWNDVSLLIRGDTLTDLSANGHTLTASGNAAAGDTSPVKFASGSLTFDGNGDYISVPDDTSLELGSGDFTIECWAYHSGAMSNYTGLMGKRADLNEKSYMFSSDNSSPERMRFLASAGTNWDVVLVDTAAFPTDQWVHVAATREGNTFTLWINGQSKATTTAAITLVDNSAPITLGRQSNILISGANEWNGNIEDVRITKGVARYTGPFDPPTASLPTNAPVVGRRGVGSVSAPLAVDTFYYWSQSIADQYASITLSNGGQTATSSGGSGRSAFGDLVVTTGKWYYEVRGNDNSVGWSTQDEAHRVRYDSSGVFTYTDTSGTTTDTGNATYGTSAIIGCAWDADTGVASFYKDGVLQGSISGGSAGQEMRAKFNGTSSVSRSAVINVGQDHTFAGAKASLTSPYTDANGFGEFYHQPPAGFVGLYTATTTTKHLRTRGYIGAAPVVPSLPTSMEVLLIGGGGGGGGNQDNGNGSGGGGAGEVKYLSSEAFTSAVSITIGAGGAGAVTTANGSNGGATSYGATTANGGGGGAKNGAAGNSVTGGSGGGGGSYSKSGGSGTYSGGTGTPSGNTNYRGGGGGGSAGNGVSGATSGNGGAGTSAYSAWATATSTGVGGAYAGGGGGGCYQPKTPGAGAAGGGSGGGVSGLNGSAAAANTGSGGGGGGWVASSHGDGGDGGSGLVIVRYSGPQALTGGTVVQSGGYTYHTFTADGTLAAGSFSPTGMLTLYDRYIDTLS